MSTVRHGQIHRQSFRWKPHIAESDIQSSRGAAIRETVVSGTSYSRGCSRKGSTGTATWKSVVNATPKFHGLGTATALPLDSVKTWPPDFAPGRLSNAS